MQSIPIRLFASVLSNIVRGFLLICISLVLARSFGPSEYGKYVYLLTSLSAFRLIIDCGSTNAFFTLLSQRHRNSQFINNYWKTTFLQYLVGVIIICVLIPDKWVFKIFVEQDRWTLFLYYNLTFIQGTIWTAVAQLAESSRFTLFAQNTNSFVVLANLLTAYLLAKINLLSPKSIIGFYSLSWLLGAFFVVRKYKHSELITCGNEIDKTSWFRDLKEILVYCAPLAPNLLMVFLHDFIDRWMLQKWAGDRQQAYFGLSQQFAAVSLIVTASVVKIFWREIAELYYKSDMAGVYQVYEKSVKLLYSLGTIITGLLQPLAVEIVAVTLGENYAPSAVTFGIMTLYPIHQSMGQIGGALLMATSNTKKFAIASSVGLLVNIFIAYILLAPQNAKLPGFGLGATGLAVKFVVGQILSVNIQGIIIARLFYWRHEWRFQILSLIAPILIGWIAKLGVGLLIGSNSDIKKIIFAYLVVYAALILSLIIAFPMVFGFSREDISKSGLVLRRGISDLKQQFF